jgi:hypothetical protein
MWSDPLLRLCVSLFHFPVGSSCGEFSFGHTWREQEGCWLLNTTYLYISEDNCLPFDIGVPLHWCVGGRMHFCKCCSGGGGRIVTCHLTCFLGLECLRGCSWGTHLLCACRQWGWMRHSMSVCLLWPHGMPSLSQQVFIKCLLDDKSGALPGLQQWVQWWQSLVLTKLNLQWDRKISKKYLKTLVECDKW